MIDFIRIHFKEKNTLEEDIKNDTQNFPGFNLVLEDRTAEIKYPYRTKLVNFEVVISEKSSHIKGSLHYYNNNINGLGNHNYNEFTHSQITLCIDKLLDIIPSINQGSITLLEFGFNINIIDVNPDEIILNRVLNFKDKAYNVKRKFQNGGWFSEFDTHDYHFKIYDKGEQFPVDNNILRLELKFTKSKKIQSFGIYSLSDLKDQKKLEKIFNFFIKRFGELAIIDDYEHVKNISLEDYNTIEKYTNPNFWSKYSNRQKRSTKYRHKKRFRSLMKKYALDQTKLTVKKLLIEKFNYLIHN